MSQYTHIQLEPSIAVNTRHSSIARKSAFYIFPYTCDDLEHDIPLKTKPFPEYTTNDTPITFAPTKPHTSFTVVLNERRMTCSRYASHTSYVNYFIPMSSKPTHCPQCPSDNCMSTTYDYADVLVTRYHHKAFTRKVALWCLNELNRLNLTRQSSHKYEIEDIMSNLGITQLSQRPKCYLTSHCSSCGGSFTVLSNNTPVQATPPMYCIWCGQQSLSVTQEDTEETAMISLASHYNIPLILFKHLYDIWHSDSKYQYFSQFITDEPTIQPILTKLRTPATNVQSL